MFKDKTLLVTGGTGSFGNAVIRRFANHGLGEIRIFSRDEKKQDDMRKLYGNERLSFYLGDVRDLNSVKDAMRGVDYVFHAAALKQVPSCEFYPLQAVRTNVFGTENVIDAAAERGASKVVVLSTDKAVYPINAMGLTKALMEKVMVAKSRSLEGTGLVVCGVRYGNVMASRGSVIPLFLSQIETNKPVTITDPAMTRFMMSLDDAIALVQFAFEKGANGSIFIKKASSVSMEQLARCIKKYAGKPNHPSQIIGTRHGEKLYETLLTREEMAHAADCGEYFCISADNRDLNYQLYLEKGQHGMSKISEYHSHNAGRYSDSEFISKLRAAI
ncbi:MAG: UDP-glucose 4-epimerase [Verrucomicrobiales bacterium]|nr:UDP-glucose 4-epimerase [Verrucomicrobiales bacterium]|tara:strand:+ start:2105 stop:3094 length:990 start_codon:yes stop_codon:yes gene_type:complete